MNRLNDFEIWQTRAQAQTELILSRMLPENDAFSSLHEAMRYVALGGGKRLRPLLVLAASQLGQAVPEALERAMVAVECIHVYSLVHDDMPAMDNDDLRRGKPTCHIRYDEATALLVGDALQTLAFDVLSQAIESLPAARQLEMVSTLAKASGSAGMAGGQAMDLAHVGKMMSQSQLEQMHGLKTGALIVAAVRLGALACPDVEDDTLLQLERFAQKLGLAFQVIDDVLDCESDTATLGKTAGKDEQANKPTYVRLLGLDGARAYAQQLANEAMDCLSLLPNKQTELLRGLVQFTIGRQY